MYLGFDPEKFVKDIAAVCELHNITRFGGDICNLEVEGETLATSFLYKHNLRDDSEEVVFHDPNEYREYTYIFIKD